MLQKEPMADPDFFSTLPYYEQLRKQCAERESEGCCLASVNAMEQKGFSLKSENGCPDGFMQNRLLCVDSYTWCILDNDIEKATNESNDGMSLLFESVTSFFGGAEIITIHTDRTFVRKNNSPVNQKTTCSKGDISKNDYDSLVTYLRSSEILNTKILQKRDQSLLCEGAHRIKVQIDGTSNEVVLPCVSEQTAETRQIKNLVDEIEKKIISVIGNSAQGDCATEDTQTQESVTVPQDWSV